MNRFWQILKIVLGAFLVYAGSMHFTNPDFFLKVIPPFLAEYGLPIVYISGVMEIIIGIMTLIKAYEVQGLTGYLALMLVFLPLHIGDVFDDTPFTGSQNAAWIRLVIQFVLIGLLWKLRNVFNIKKPNK